MQKGLTECAQGKKVVLPGMRLSLNDLCKDPWSPTAEDMLMVYSRTYGQETGEDIREGYDPTDESSVDPKDGEQDEFTIGEDEEPQDSEESRHWKEAKDVKESVTLKPKYGVDGEAFENVWGEPSQLPKENP
jgi:hypothetical protein